MHRLAPHKSARLTCVLLAHTVWHCCLLQNLVSPNLLSNVPESYLNIVMQVQIINPENLK